MRAARTYSAEIAQSCGHSTPVDVEIGRQPSARMVAYMGSQPCRDCARAQAQANATRQESVFEYAELAGSEKQINWAREIRATLMDATREYAQSLAGIDQGRYDQAVEAQTWAARIADARWWIDHRNERTLSEPYTQSTLVARRTGRPVEAR